MNQFVPRKTSQFVPRKTSPFVPRKTSPFVSIAKNDHSVSCFTLQTVHEIEKQFLR